jgi:hypothetical protein
VTPVAIDIRLISLRDFIKTDVVGAIDLETSKIALTEIVRSSSKSGVPNVLIDTRMARPVKFTPTDIHTLVVHLLALGIDPEYRIAILNDPKDVIDGGKLFEEYARQRGMDVAAFRDYEAALTWLCSISS